MKVGTIYMAMNKIGLMFIVFCLSLIPALSHSSDKDKTRVWHCYQVGVIKTNVKGKKKSRKEKSTLVVSNVFADSAPHNYAERAEQFAKQVSIDTNNKFVGHFDPQCVASNSGKRAMKDRQKKIERAKKRSYNILPIEFRYHPSQE